MGRWGCGSEEEGKERLGGACRRREREREREGGLEIVVEGDGVGCWMCEDGR